MQTTAKPDKCGPSDCKSLPVQVSAVMKKHMQESQTSRSGHQGAAGSQEGCGSSKSSAVKVWTGTQVTSTSALGKSCNFPVPLWWFNISQKFRSWIFCIPNSRTPEVALESLQVPFARDSRKDHVPQQKSMVFASCLVLTGPRATAWAISCLTCSKLAVVQGLTWNQSSSMLQDREGLESGCALGLSKNP